jgi:hypothetical protein
VIREEALRRVREAVAERKAAAASVRQDLLGLAQDQSGTRKGARWATELARAAATIEHVYGLENE